MKFKNGWLESAKHVPSPNFNTRPEGEEIALLVIHNISLPPGQFGGGYIEKFFQNKLSSAEHPYFETIEGLEVSSHFLITRCGEIVQFVSCLDRAWHAGQSCFNGRENCNDFSIGIELEGTDDIPYDDRQYRALSELTTGLFKAFPQMSADKITGHCDIAPERKTDPGESFDWKRYRDGLHS